VLHDFVLEAIGMQECLSPDNNEVGTVSLNTIEIRIRLLQQGEPGRAHRCGVPPVDDQERLEKIARNPARHGDGRQAEALSSSK